MLMRLKEEMEASNDGKHGGEGWGGGGSVEAATGWTLTRFMSVPHFFLFPMSLSPSPTPCLVVHT